MKETHNERFAMVEARYLETRDNTYLGEMYLICVDLAVKFIGKITKKYCSPDDEAVHDSALYLIDRYLKDPGFRLSEKMSGYFYYYCLHAVHADSAWDKRKVSFEDWMQEIA
jgi:hypothetical protein